MKETEVRSLTQFVIVIYVFNNKIRNVYRKVEMRHEYIK